MKNQTFIKAVLFCSLLVLVVPPVQGAARSSSSRRGGWGLYGDWQVKADFEGRQFESILSFSRDRQGNRTGQWISFWGLSELKDVKFEEDQLSFSRTSRNREGQSSTSKFTGTIKDGKLSGTISSDRGQYKLEGKRSPRIPRAVGSWEIKFKIGEREITSTLVVKTVKSDKPDEEDKLTAEWQSQRYEHQITDVQYERGNLTFKRKSKIEDRQFDSTFEGTIQRETDTLSGVMKSERGEIKVEGKRIGAAVIGTWDLEVTSERGSRKQRLKVNQDMTGLYGAIPIKKVNLKDDKVSFKIVMEFGERKFEWSFEGKLAEAKEPKESTLTGELKTSRGSSKVTGKKVIRTFTRRSSSTG